MYEEEDIHPRSAKGMTIHTKWPLVRRSKGTSIT